MCFQLLKPIFFRKKNDFLNEIFSECICREWPYKYCVYRSSLCVILSYNDLFYFPSSFSSLSSSNRNLQWGSLIYQSFYSLPNRLQISGNFQRLPNYIFTSAMNQGTYRIEMETNSRSQKVILNFQFNNNRHKYSNDFDYISVYINYV